MKLLLRSLLVWLLLGFVLRGFMWVTYPQASAMPGAVEFLAGLFNDLQSFSLLAGCLVLCAAFGKHGLKVGLFVLCAIAMVVAFAEVFFWLEFESRLDRLVFHYLAFPKEVVVFLEDQFFVSLFLIPFLLLTWGVVSLLGWSQQPIVLSRVHWLWPSAALVILLYGQPIGQGISRTQNEFVSNGYLGVLVAARYDEQDVAWLAQSGGSEFAAHPVNLPGSLSTPSLLQDVRDEVKKIKHVILIVEESFAGPAWRDPALRQRYLPNFSALAETSLNFTNAYATGSRTTRGLEALLNGFPPLPGISTNQRPGYSNLPSLARGMNQGGFYPVFLYGGWPGFSNFSNYWTASGFREIWTREDFDELFETSWGVSDQALFKRLVTQMSELTRRHDSVFLATLTVSHHRPYDFPEGAVDFPASARRSEYALAYADHSLGEFFQLAKNQPWYEDTLFVVVADHGLHARGDALIPAASYRIPLLMHAENLQPRTMQGMASAMSLPKTLMMLFDIDTSEQFAGDNLICDCDTTVPVEYGYHVGLLDRDQLSVMTSDGRAVSWRHDVDTDQLSDPAQGSTGSEQQILQIFAPAYRSFYKLPAGNRLSDMDHAKIVVD